MTPFPRLVLSGVHSGVGKTTVALGILSALRRRGLSVQPFKAGPDFLDPGHHTAAAGGRVSRNLDTWMMPAGAVRELFARSAAGADLSLIEGAMGLFDGVSGRDGAGSAADLARLLDAPVVLVVDAKGMARSAAALVHGYATMDPALDLRGVIFNRVSGPGHYRILRDAVSSLTSVAPLGWLGSDPSAAVPERHLGLVPAAEGTARYAAQEALVAGGVDLDALLALARRAPPLRPPPPAVFAPSAARRVRVAVSRDRVFHFVYEDNLDLLRHLGAETAFFSPLEDRAVPDGTDLVWLGGGYPELFAEALSENREMRASLRDHAARGGAVYAECGGLMYALEALLDRDGRTHPMSGLLPGRSRMMPRRQGLGYLEVSCGLDSLLAPSGARFRAHEFHYSRLDPAPSEAGVPSALTVSKPWKGEAPRPDGWVRGRVMAGYAHVHFAACPGLAARLLERAVPG